MSTILHNHTSQHPLMATCRLPNMHSVCGLQQNHCGSVQPEQWRAEHIINVLDTRKKTRPVLENDYVVDAGYSMLNRRYMDRHSDLHTDSNSSDGNKEVKNIAKKVFKHEGTKFGKLKSQNDSLRQQLTSSSALQSQQLSNNSQVQWDAIYHLSNETELLKDTTLIGWLSTFSVPSCAALPPFSLSGYYWVMTSYGSTVRVYCDMTRSCGGVTGGWMRVA